VIQTAPPFPHADDWALGVGMRRLFTTSEASAAGLTSKALRCGEASGRWRRVRKGVYAEGSQEPTLLDRRLAEVVARDGVADGCLAGVLHGLDGVDLDGRPPRRRSLPPERVVRVAGVRRADGLQTLVDLAADLDDLRWEQALESALRRRLLALGELEALVAELGRARVPGTARIRRVLALRPPGAAPTESLLETLMVQLARTVPGLPDPVRQLEVGWARLDLAWPGLGLFVELDGQHHARQPLYDARRETAVVAATGWLCGRFTWTEVVRVPTTTVRRLAALAEQARRRPIVAQSDLMRP
jgi:very-short-patch-repair endonuclease